jgi:hypothetical protein
MQELLAILVVGASVAKGSTEARKGVRRTRGLQWWAHQWWRMTEKAGISRRRRFGHGGRLQRYRQRRKAKGIRWERQRNCRLNGKTERDRRDERDGVLTFGQRWTTAMEEPARVGEEPPDLAKMTEATSDSRDWAHHGVELDEGNSRVVSTCTVSARFRRKNSSEVRRNLVDAKVRWGFVEARVIETERGWRCWKEDAKEIAGNYLLAQIESDFF